VATSKNAKGDVRLYLSTLKLFRQTLSAFSFLSEAHYQSALLKKGDFQTYSIKA
jgi:hypothetical protein